MAFSYLAAYSGSTYIGRKLLGQLSLDKQTFGKLPFD
jgi:hypothetical protein